MNLSFFQRRSLRTRVTFFTLVIFLMSVWVVSYYASQMLRRDMERLLSEQQVSNVAMIAAGIGRELQNRMATLEKVAALATPAVLDTPLAMQSLLEQRPDLHALFNNGIYATRLDGTAIADFPLSAERRGVNYSDRDYIASPLTEGKAMIGRPVIGKKARAPILGMLSLIHISEPTRRTPISYAVF